MDILINESTVIEAGNVIVSTDDIIEFKIENLNFIFSFENRDGNDSALDIKAKKKEDGTDYLSIVFVNTIKDKFKSFCPSVEVAEINGKRLKVAFILETLIGDDMKNKLLTYTWTLDK